MNIYVQSHVCVCIYTCLSRLKVDARTLPPSFSTFTDDEDSLREKLSVKFSAYQHS